MAKKSSVTLELKSPRKTNSILTGGDGKTGPQPMIDSAACIAAIDGLFDRFNVDRTDWQSLVLLMGVAGGFIKFPRTTGPVTRWNDGLRLALWLQTQLSSYKHQRKIAPVFQDSEFLQRWSEKSGEPESPLTLSTRYYESEKNPGALLKSVIAMFQAAEIAGSKNELFLELAPGMAEAAFEVAAIQRADEMFTREFSARLSTGIP